MLNNLAAALVHGIDWALHMLDFSVLPRGGNSGLELRHVVVLAAVPIDSSSKQIPYIFYRIKIWWSSWPLNHLHFHLIEESTGLIRPEDSCIILLKIDFSSMMVVSCEFRQIAHFFVDIELEEKLNNIRPRLEHAVDFGIEGATAAAYFAWFSMTDSFTSFVFRKLRVVFLG